MHNKYHHSPLGGSSTLLEGSMGDACVVCIQYPCVLFVYLVLPCLLFVLPGLGVCKSQLLYVCYAIAVGVGTLQHAPQPTATLRHLQ